MKELKNPITDRKDFNRQVMTAKKTKEGYYLNGTYNNTNTIANSYGCNNCPWRGSPLCPHGLKGLQTHTNKICSQRIDYIKDLLITSKSHIRPFQIEQMVRIKLILDKMEKDYSEGLNLNRQFSSVQKNMISLMDKVRKQDEGIKIHADISHSVKEFQDVVDVQSKVVEDKDIVEEAKKIKDGTDKPDNGERKELSEPEV